MLSKTDLLNKQECLKVLYCVMCRIMLFISDNFVTDMIESNFSSKIIDCFVD